MESRERDAADIDAEFDGAKLPLFRPLRSLKVAAEQGGDCHPKDLFGDLDDIHELGGARSEIYLVACFSRRLGGKMHGDIEHWPAEREVRDRVRR